MERERRIQVSVVFWNRLYALLHKMVLKGNAAD